jgi:hypothetical protein
MGRDRGRAPLLLPSPCTILSCGIFSVQPVHTLSVSNLGTNRSRVPFPLHQSVAVNFPRKKIPKPKIADIFRSHVISKSLLQFFTDFLFSNFSFVVNCLQFSIGKTNRDRHRLTMYWDWHQIGKHVEIFRVFMKLLVCNR